MAKKIVIASGKGGVGKSTFTVGLAKALVSMGSRVLIIDCDRLRSIDLLVGVTAELVYDFGDVIKENCEPEAAIYENGGVSIISCPLSYEGIDCEDMKALVGHYDDSFDFILLDAPAGIDKGLELAASGADKGIVVSTPDLVCVRSAYTAAGELDKIGVAESRLVINRVNTKDMSRGRLLNIDKVIDSTMVQLIGVVPEDAKLRLGSMGGEIYKRGQLSRKAFSNIAKRICGQYVALDLDF